MSYQLRPYQQQAVDAVLSHFRQDRRPCCVVLPTGAGKSVVIAELARLARGKVLVLAHVKELVAQNHEKYHSLTGHGVLFAAGLKQKRLDDQVVFASIQSLARNLDALVVPFSLVIIDESHRLAQADDSQYQQLLQVLRQQNERLCVLGLTATPYRLTSGWIYQQHYHGIVRSIEPKPFFKCVFELPLRTLIKAGFLTTPVVIDAPVAQYDFAALAHHGEQVSEAQVNALLVRHPRVTQAIIEQVQALASARQGVMIFAATTAHAKEIIGYLPAGQAALVLGDTPQQERDALIQQFKARALKYLVNVSVLTTGFDAPHVDFIAILRPTDSVSLYQQIVGRGLRLAANKVDCWVMDYAGNGYDIFYPEVGEKKPNPEVKPVQVLCPACGFANVFWGKTDDQGAVIEHYGRRCQGLLGEPEDVDRAPCGYRFVFKSCPHCGQDNDIAARACQHCHARLIDPDEQLKAALSLKNAKVYRIAGLEAQAQGSKLTLRFYDEDGHQLTQIYDSSNVPQWLVFNQQFGRRLKGLDFTTLRDAAHAEQLQAHLCAPDFIVTRLQKGKERVQELIFDYQGRYRKAFK